MGQHYQHYHRMKTQKAVHTLLNLIWLALGARCYVYHVDVFWGFYYFPCIYAHMCDLCMYACVRVLSQTKPSCLPPHQARQVLLHWNESSDVCICNVVLSSSAWWNLTLLIILMCLRKEQSTNTFSEVRLMRPYWASKAAWRRPHKVSRHILKSAHKSDVRFI